MLMELLLERMDALLLLLHPLHKLLLLLPVPILERALAALRDPELGLVSRVQGAKLAAQRLDLSLRSRSLSTHHRRRRWSLRRRSIYLPSRLLQPGSDERRSLILQSYDRSPE